MDISADSEFDKSKMQFFPNFLQKCCLFFYISYRSETKEIPLSTTVTTSSDDALVSYDNFVQHKFRYLVGENKTETKAVTSDDCIWECLTFKTCLSLNVGSVPDDGSVWCKLLFTDMFTSSRSLHENASSHHLSRWVSIFKRQYSSTDVFSFLQPVHRILHINLLWLLCCCVRTRLLAVPYCDYRKTHVAVALFSRSSKNSMLWLPSKKRFCAIIA